VWSFDAEFYSDDDDDKVDRSPWQPRTPPLTLLRLLGVRHSQDNDDSAQPRPPSLAPADSVFPGLIPSKTFVEANGSASSSLPSFLDRFSQPEVVDRPLQVLGRRQVSGNGPQSDLSDEVVDGKPEVNFGEDLRLPHLRITSGGKQRWLSRDRDVTAADDVIDATKTGNTTDERRDSDVSTVSKASSSTTPRTSPTDDADSTTATVVQQVAAHTQKDGAAEGDALPESHRFSDDDNKTLGETPFQVERRQHRTSVRPGVPPPRHQMTLLHSPPAQWPRFHPPSFSRFPSHRQPPPPPGRRVHAPHNRHGTIQNIDPARSPIGQKPLPSWNGVAGPSSDTAEPLNRDVAGSRTSSDEDLEREEGLDEELNVEGKTTTAWTTTSQPDSTSTDEDTPAALNENHADVTSRRGPTSGYELMTTSTSTLVGVKSTLASGRTEQGRSVSHAAAHWTHSAAAASVASAASFNWLGTFFIDRTQHVRVNLAH